MSIFKIFGRKAEAAWTLYKARPYLREAARRMTDMERLKSRKLWVTIIVGLIAVLNDAFGRPLPEEVLEKLITLALGFLGAQGLVDVAKAIRRS